MFRRRVSVWEVFHCRVSVWAVFRRRVSVWVVFHCRVSVWVVFRRRGPGLGGRLPLVINDLGRAGLRQMVAPHLPLRRSAAAAARAAPEAPVIETRADRHCERPPGFQAGRAQSSAGGYLSSHRRWNCGGCIYMRCRSIVESRDDIFRCAGYFVGLKDSVSNSRALYETKVPIEILTTQEFPWFSIARKGSLRGGIMTYYPASR